jgi:hypothetical protein
MYDKKERARRMGWEKEDGFTGMQLAAVGPRSGNTASAFYYGYSCPRTN